jgi:hypothetical protein
MAYRDEPSPAKSAMARMADLGVMRIAPDAQADFTRTYDRVFQETQDEVKAQLAAYGALRRRQFGLPVKSVMTPDYLVVGWGIWYSAPMFLDRQETHFHTKTALLLDYYKDAPLWYEHGEDRDYGIEPIGKRAGYEVYDHGVWLTHELFPEHPLFNRTVSELERGLLAYSSDSMGQYVRRGYDPNKKALNAWPMAGCSLTKEPAEPGLGGTILETRRPGELTIERLS